MCVQVSVCKHVCVNNGMYVCRYVCMHADIYIYKYRCYFHFNVKIRRNFK